jgi:hypothetical protein
VEWGGQASTRGWHVNLDWVSRKCQACEEQTNSLLAEENCVGRSRHLRHNIKADEPGVQRMRTEGLEYSERGIRGHVEM